MKIGENIKKFRKESGLSQQELADLVKIHQSNVSRWEKDISRPDYETLIKLAEVLGVTINDILDVD